MRKFIYLALLLLLPVLVQAQSDSLKSKLDFTGDFRFRLEQDWDSRKADGTYRDDRTRLRYRVRFGAKYQYNSRLSFGLRLRTGQQHKQQDPQLTLGDGFNEFGTLPIGFEKIYFKSEHNGLLLWLGKNSFPFKKQNELFWSDNVYPEGVFISKLFNFESSIFETLKLSAGHFIISTKGTSLEKDNFFRGFQIHTTHLDNKLEFFPSIYYFKNTPNIPDGNETHLLDYSIIHFGTKVKLFPKPLINFELDVYHNVENYDSNELISDNFKKENNGFTSAIGIGALKEKNDLLFKVTYTHMERFSAVDFLAQNDWVRWDYSSSGSPDGRLTNFKGFEITAGYVIAKKLTLKLRYYNVNQIIPYGIAKENGNRLRLDLDIGF